MNDFILWGSHPSHGDEPLKLDCGTLRQCRGAMKRREADGWRGLVIVPDESIPNHQISIGVRPVPHPPDVSKRRLDD